MPEAGGHCKNWMARQRRLVRRGPRRQPEARSRTPQGQLRPATLTRLVRCGPIWSHPLVMRFARSLAPSLAALVLATALAGPAAAQQARSDGDRTDSVDDARHERRLIAACGAEWDAIKRKGGAQAELTWRRFWESCRAR